MDPTNNKQTEVALNDDVAEKTPALDESAPFESASEEKYVAAVPTLDLRPEYLAEKSMESKFDEIKQMLEFKIMS